MNLHRLAIPEITWCGKLSRERDQLIITKRNHGIIHFNHLCHIQLIAFLVLSWLEIVLDGLSLIIELNRAHDSFYLKNTINYSYDIKVSKILAIYNIEPTLFIFSN